MSSRPNEGTEGERIAELTATDAARRIRDGDLSAVELTRACLARIDDDDARIRAWTHVAREGALALAAEREREARAGRTRGPLHGVPVGIKDIIHVAAMPTTAGAGRFARAAFRAAMAPLLEAHDVLLTPVAPSPAPPGLTSTGDPMFCGPWSFIGVPSISLPSAVGASELPLAIQLVAAAGREDRLFAAAAWCERVLDFRASPPGSSVQARA